MPRIRLATNNPHKVREAALALKPFGIEVEQLPADKVEIQADDVAAVARHAAERLCGLGDWVAVEDTGLYVAALGGFPGPYAEYVYRTIGVRGLLRLMEGVEDRSAVFRTAVALCLRGEVAVFLGEARGRIAEEPRGSGGFGFDPVFIPEGFDRTYAEMGEEEKAAVSHRSAAFRALARWLAFI